MHTNANNDFLSETFIFSLRFYNEKAEQPHKGNALP